ncbi:MAG: hypothetical protein WCF67_21500 [Chitinophagaceae bacterium]
MNQEITASDLQISVNNDDIPVNADGFMYAHGFPLYLAVTQALAYRSGEDCNGVVHWREDILNYVKEGGKFDQIVARQTVPVPEHYRWAVGHFFMRDEHTGCTSFCVAPILKKYPETDFPELPKVIDPFKHNCGYNYTYAKDTIKPGSPHNEESADVYDMGEMWP